MVLLTSLFTSFVQSVGQMASSEATTDPYASSATMTGAQCMDRNPEYPYVQEQPDCHRGNRRIREVSSTIHSRDQISDSYFGAGTLRGPFAAMQSPSLDPLTRAMAMDGLSSNGRPSSLAESIALQRSQSGLTAHPGGPLQQLADRQAMANSGISNLMLPTQGIGRFRPSLFPASPALSSGALSSRLLSSGPLSSGLSLSELGPDSFAGGPRPSQDLIQHLFASRHHSALRAQPIPRDDEIQRLHSLADGILTAQQRRAQQVAVATPPEQVDTIGPRGIAKFQNQQLEKPRSSPSEANTDSISTKLSKKSKPQKKPIRFFNAGTEISIDGYPVTSSNTVSCTEKQTNGKENTRKHRKRRIAPDVAEEEEKRQFEVQNLQEQQRSIWDAFVLDGDEKTKEKKKSKEKNGDEQVIDPSQLYSDDPSKIATASMDDIVKDSLTERLNMLSAASVLMALTPRGKR